MLNLGKLLEVSWENSLAYQGEKYWKVLSNHKIANLVLMSKVFKNGYGRKEFHIFYQLKNSENAFARNQEEEENNLDQFETDFRA